MKEEARGLKPSKVIVWKILKMKLNYKLNLKLSYQLMYFDTQIINFYSCCS